MTERLAAVFLDTALFTPADTYIVPVLIANEGNAAGWRYVEFLTANINNPNTRQAYALACARFFAWCETWGATLDAIRPFHVTAWVSELQEKHGGQLLGHGISVS